MPATAVLQQLLQPLCCCSDPVGGPRLNRREALAAAIAARKGEHTIGAYSTPATVIAATVIAAAAGAFSTLATVTAESAGRGSPANMAQGEVQAAAGVQAETLVKQDASKTDMHDPSKRVSKKPSPL
jgi:hypothetical protein